MNEVDPIELLFGGMEKLGPGSNTDTLKVLQMLPKQLYPLVVDAGCGSGRQSLILAEQLKTVIHAVDSYEPFLRSLEKRAEEVGIGNLIRTYCMDMADIPNSFQEIDLFWSEGAAYNIGFTNALNIWCKAIKQYGFWSSVNCLGYVKTFLQKSAISLIPAIPICEVQRKICR